MICASSRPLQLGKVYRPGTEDGPIAVTDGSLKAQSQFCFQVLREATRDEYMKFWEEQGGSNYQACTDQFFYLVSMD